MFDDQYKKLNEQQRKAVDTIEGPVMVIAGPGTGKTTVLTLRIANILRKTDTPPGGILAITYTEAGVRAMRAKLELILGTRAKEIHIHTFHSFAAYVIKKYPEHFIHIHDTKQLTELDQETILRDILHDSTFDILRPIGDPDFYIPDIIQEISHSKREAITPEMIKEYAYSRKKEIEGDEASYVSKGKSKGEIKGEIQSKLRKIERSIVLADVYTAYEDTKKKKKVLDYDDLIFEILLTFGRDELLLRQVQEQFLYVHIDEHQDTNRAQNTIIDMLVSYFDVPNIFIVGDEKQAVYRFQGASVENFMRLRKRYTSMQVIQLNQNYRSHQHLLDATYSLIENNYGVDESKELRFPLIGRAGETKIDIHSAPKESDGIQFLISSIKQNQEDTAVIVRTNKEVTVVAQALKAVGIEVTAQRSVSLISQTWSVMFLDMLSSIIYPEKTDKLVRFITAGGWNIPFVDRVTCISEIKAGRIPEEIQKKYIQIQTYIDTVGVLEALTYLVQESGLLTKAIQSPHAMNIWRAWYHIASGFIDQEQISSSRILFERLLSLQLSSREYHVPIETKGTVSVLTAHGSKGLEFDTVYVLNTIEERWIRRGRPRMFDIPHHDVEGNEEKDARRLFYVALTRAKKHAICITPMSSDDGAVFEPLRFLNELGVHTKQSQVQSFEPPVSTKKNIPKEIHQYLKDVLVSKGLSITAINNYVKCPSLFVFSSLFRVPQAPAATSEKGIVMHDAIAKVWLSTSRDSNDIERIFKERITYHKEHSKLGIGEQRQVYGELEKILPDISRSLASHFKQKGTVESEVWQEAHSYLHTYEEKEYVIPLHGKLDVLIDTPPQIFVFDYKTKQSMTRNAIMGKTKSEDGGYFRQLVFYHFLLKDNVKYKGKIIIPGLVFVIPDAKGECHIETFEISQGDHDMLQDCIKTVVNDTFDGTLLSKTCKDKDCQWCLLKHAIVQE